MKKLILAILIAAIFTMGAASAQWLSDAYTTELAAAGAPAYPSTDFDEYADRVTATFHDLGSDGMWTYWGIPLAGGTHLTQNNDFYAEFRITTSNLASGGSSPKAHFGLINSDTIPVGAPPGGKIKNAVAAEFGSGATTTLKVYLYDTDGVVTSATGTSGLIEPNTNYIVKISFDSITDTLTATVTSTDDATVIDSVNLDTSTSAFSVDTLAAFSSYSMQNNVFTFPWTIYSGKANSGTTEDGETIVSENQNDVEFSTSSTGGGQDPTLTSLTGIHTIFIKTSGYVVGSIDVNFDESKNNNDIVLPPLTLAVDWGNGIAMMFHQLAWSTVPQKALTPVVTNPYLYVPQTTGSPFYCPLTEFTDQSPPISTNVNTNCQNPNLNPTVYGNPTMNGVTTYQIANGGGGNAGTPGTQTVYADSYNRELAVDGQLSAGTTTIQSILGFESVTGTFMDAGFVWEHWYAPLLDADSNPVTLDETTDFYAEFRILTPPSFTASAGTAHAIFGLIDSTTPPVYPVLVNVLGARFDSTGLGVSPLSADLHDSTGALSTIGSGAVILQPDTKYIVTLSYDATTTTLSADVYLLSNGLNLGTETLVLSQGTTFTADSVAIFGSYTTASTSGFNAPWTIYSAKVNSGTTEYGQIISMDNQNPNNLVFDTSDTPGTVTSDPTKVSQTGTKTVYVKSVSSSYVPAGSIEVDFDSDPMDIVLPTVDVGTLANEGKAFMHPTGGDSAWPASVTNAYVYVPILGLNGLDVIYRCPNAVDIDSISESCPGYESSPTGRTQVSIGGVRYAQIHNQGGGNGGSGPGGSSVPEFSDLAWILAAVLGAGGFYLIRRQKSF